MKRGILNTWNRKRERKICRLERTIKRLQKRIKELEASQVNEGGCGNE